MRALTCLMLCLGLAAHSAIAGPGAHGPNGEHLDAGPANTTPDSIQRLPDGSVFIPKAAQRRLAIRTLPARAGEYAQTVSLNGRVQADPGAAGRVQAPFAGRIEAGPQGLPLPGAKVEKNQILAYLTPQYSAQEMANQTAQLAELRAMRKLAAQKLARLHMLEGVVAQKEVDAASAELASLQAREQAVAASREKLALRAPVAGLIAHQEVRLGQLVEGREVLFEIMDPARLMVLAHSSDASLRTRIASASVAGMPQVQLHLRGAGAGMRDGVLPLYFQLDSKGAALALAQPLTVLAQLKEKTPGIALPSQALVRNSANENVVWIKAGAERFIAMPVSARALDANTVLISKGLSPENRVVSEGASLINQIK
ncbi:efflux RND transporter periplasmic adaptor subunit [Massilia sp. W12]|uniref:efflux RND transporter periplasmic adaptor subunit n=1 Tax=Massilia sp. W12 TaxID=3126507 RepID=UPI0030D52D09